MIYFKSTSKELIHEAALTEYLSMLHPNILPEILAVEVDRGFAIARRLWTISSALRWHLVISPLPDHLCGEYVLAVPSLLQEFLEANREELR